jgi:diguanylate cyclase (GGDEF)-like protein
MLDDPEAGVARESVSRALGGDPALEEQGGPSLSREAWPRKASRCGGRKRAEQPFDSAEDDLVGRVPQRALASLPEEIDLFLQRRPGRAENDSSRSALRGEIARERARRHGAAKASFQKRCRGSRGRPGRRDNRDGHPVPLPSDAFTPYSFRCQRVRFPAIFALMPVYQLSLLIQAAGTGLLFFLFLLVHQKIHLRALPEWIASWAFLLAGLALLWLAPALGRGRSILFLNNTTLLLHAFFLLRGIRQLRSEKAASSADLLWILPIFGIAWVTAAREHLAFVPLVLTATYVTAAIWFAVTPGSTVGRLLLSISFLLWGVERAVIGAAFLRSHESGGLPETLQYAGFAAMLLEMMVAVGVILLLFEASQTRLASEMEQLRHFDQLLKEKSVRDPLTGLYNRRHFNDVLRRELVSARLAGATLSVLLADVDRFKQINDRMGHAVGDDVLKFVANYLTSCVRESDFVFRWGGDEFLVLLPRTDEAIAAQKAEELGHRLPHIPGVERVQPSLSVGWATHRSGQEFSETLATADSRMYDMKVKGRQAGV